MSGRTSAPGAFNDPKPSISPSYTGNYRSLSPDGAGLAPRTIGHVHRLLHDDGVGKDDSCAEAAQACDL